MPAYGVYADPDGLSSNASVGASRQPSRADRILHSDADVVAHDGAGDIDMGTQAYQNCPAIHVKAPASSFIKVGADV